MGWVAHATRARSTLPAQRVRPAFVLQLPPMRRWARRILVALSLSLCLCLSALWVRSLYAMEDLILPASPATPQTAGEDRQSAYYAGTMPHMILLGANYEWHRNVPFDNPAGIRERWISFPIWPPVLLSAIAPALAIRAIVRLRLRIRRGRCLACGYSLRRCQ